MGIKELTAVKLGKKKKSDWRFDKKRELWVTWQVRAEFDGVPHVRRGFLTEADAKDYLKQLGTQERLKKIGVVDLIKFPTVKKLFDRHLDTFASKRAKTQANRVYKKFLSLLKPKNLKINELKRKHFKDYADARLAEGVKPETVDREITDISAAIHKAGDYFENLENWSVPDKLIYRPAVADEGRSRIVTRDERTRLIPYLLREREPSESESECLARRRTGLIAYFAPLTGLRHSEIAGLRKSNFDAPNRRLTAERSKTKKTGVRWTTFEPLTDTQIWILEEAAQLYPNGEFFFSDKGKLHNKTYDILERACRDLKIPYGKNTPGGFILHDMRHTFVTILEQQMIDSSTTRSFSGHSKDAMLKRYAHATPDSRARAMQIIEREVGLPTPASDERENELLAIYEAVRAGKISFDAFSSATKSFYGFLTESQENDVADVGVVTERKTDFVQ